MGLAGRTFSPPLGSVHCSRPLFLSGVRCASSLACADTLVRWPDTSELSYYGMVD
jgi:hypothetical protein